MLGCHMKMSTAILVLQSIVFYALLCGLGQSQQYDLFVLTNPLDCFGGTVCITQPVVSVVYRATGEIAYSFQGSIYAQLDQSPTGNEKLYYGSPCDLSSCGVEVVGTLASVPIDNGVATFNHLYLKRAGSGYTLRFIGRTVGGKDFAAVSSDAFTVKVGSPYKLQFYNYTGNAFGGEKFSNNPTVGVVDRGGNVVVTSTGAVTVSLVSSPTGAEKLRTESMPSMPFTVPIMSGLAIFRGLYINEAGFPYQLGFSCSQCGGVASTVSNLFHVAIGNVSQLIIVPGTDPANHTVYGGEFLKVPPAVRLLDAGGNFVSRDNSSALLVTIKDNPSRSTLNPPGNVFVVARGGKVQFSQLSVDHTGSGYTLLFTLYTYSTGFGNFSATNITVSSGRFNVEFGPARQLQFRRRASGAWAGQQGFWNQPTLWITDYGGNLLSTDFTTMVSMKVVESLSVHRQIVIDTSSAPQTVLTNVSTNWISNITYGAGEVLLVTLVSPYRVSVVTSAYGVLPAIALNIGNTAIANYTAWAQLVGDVVQTKTLTFEYVVASGDYSLAGALLGANALVFRNESSIVDGNNNIIDASIPDSPIHNISTTIPRIVNFESNTTSGEYGAGQLIRFTVTFDQPVVVKGHPYLILTANCTDPLTQLDIPANATFSGRSDDGLHLSFDYLVEGNQRSGSVLTLAIPQIMFTNFTLNTTVADEVVLNSSTNELGYQYNYRWRTFGEVWIRRMSTNPTTDVNTTFTPTILSQFEAAHQIVIDTAEPALDATFGVQSSNTSGVYHVGDHISLFVRFDKPIAWYGVSLRLRIDSGNTLASPIHGSAFVRSLLPDERTLKFIYIVRDFDNTSHLDIISTWNALQLVSNASYVKRLSTFPTTNANFDISGVFNGGHSLRDTANISAHGFPLTVASVVLTHPTPAVITVLVPDDIMLFDVKFTGPVVANCTPVLALTMNNYREAVYLSGNGTDVFKFKYTVHMGDKIDHISYRTTPSALCASSLCPLRSTCAILASTTEPSQPIDIRVPKLSSLLANHSIVPISPTRNTTISNIRFLQDGGEYGAGSVLQIQVTFTDIVIVFGTVKPRLQLNIGKYADYSAGNYDSKLIFRYITTEDDQMLSDLAAALVNGTTSALHCVSPTCYMINQADQSVNLTTALAIVGTPSNITLDPTPANVSDVYFAMKAGKAVYSAGDLIELVVVPSKPVVVGGIFPRIQLRLFPSNPFAVYTPELSNDLRLVFTYRSRVTEITSNLSYLSDSINAMDGYSMILRASSIPITPMDLKLPAPIDTVIPSQMLFIDSQSVPRVLNVTFANSSGRVAVGDSVVAVVRFSMRIVALGHSRLALNLGNHAAFANYIGYLPLNCSDCINNWIAADFNETSPAVVALVYRYTIQPGDANAVLDYVDYASLQVLFTTNHDRGYIKRVDNVVAIDADLTLPLPGTPGSLSNNGIAIRVDGHQPYLTSLSFLSPAGVFSTDSLIEIAMNFSAPVVVRGGVPSILLETGAFKNEAIYVGGNASDCLVFHYVPEPGDFNLFLDYYSSREDFNSASSSFLYNGAVIQAASEQPSQNAHIWLNPPRGHLMGMVNTVADGGIVSYYDTYLSHHGLDYELRYEANDASGLSATQDIYVSFSSEYQLRPAAAIKEELIGHSVDIQGDIATMGAPDFNVSITTVQVVEISVAAGLPQREVQLIQTDASFQPAIQSFHTSAGVDQKVGGYFQISYGEYGPTQPIAANADASTIQAIIQYDLAVMGVVEVSVADFLYCACDNAHTWTITFHDFNAGTMNLLSTDGTLLEGGGATITTPSMLQSPSLLSGFFTLRAFGISTPAIPYDANATTLTSAIEATGLSVHSVFITPTTKLRTRTWSVTFEAYHDSYEVPLLTGDASGLTGAPGASVSIGVMQPGRHGPNGIAGYFQLNWRGNTTQHLLPNATAMQVKSALEALPIINTVHVIRTLLTPEIGAYSWTIDFVSVNYHNSRGYFEDQISNLEPIVPINHLIATDSNIFVDAKWELGSLNRLSSAARQGTFGTGAGAVFVYQRTNDSWTEVATLRGNDTVEDNRFGGSVSVDNGAILIGAVGANMNGRPEKQAIHCLANDGYFQIAFRGWQTDFISCNVTRFELQDAIVSPSTTFSKLHSITSLTIDDWGAGPLCANNTAILTFYSPVDGAPHLFDGVDTRADLEPLTLMNFNLSNWDGSNATLADFEVQKGTWKVHGLNADVQQLGAAYVFRLQDNCTALNQTLCLKANWTQEAQFFPPIANLGAEYGFAVSLESNIAVVGAPGTNNNSGSVYIYEYDVLSLKWKYLQVLVDPDYAGGSRFGNSISKSGDTIAIASLSRYDNTGTVSIFARTVAGGLFIAVQFLTSTKQSMFGADVAILGNVLAVGAPGFNSSTIYMGDTPPDFTRTQAGAVFVYQRSSTNAQFSLIQSLSPSNVREFDRFGSQVALESNVIIASSVQAYTGDLFLSKPILQIKTKAKYNAVPLSGSFKILWQTANASSERAAFTTGAIPYNSRAVDLKTILERDLPVGEVMVSRSRVDVYDGGYEWQVTFMRYPNHVDAFLADTTGLLGSNATVTVVVLNPSPPALRHNTHYFERVPAEADFVEQLYLHPFKHQHIDRCGTDVAISGHYALIGCPNRDQDVSNSNSGVGFIYDLSLLSLMFANPDQTVKEGIDAEFTLSRDVDEPLLTERDVSYYFQTLDRNADSDLQYFIASLYGISNVSLAPGQQTPLDHTGLVGKAMARSQYYGSTQRISRWVDGRYDYRAIADYAPMLLPYVTLIEDDRSSLSVSTNPDTLVEDPAESFAVIVTTPGLWPSVLGKLIAHATLDDHSTGHVMNQTRYAKLVSSDADKTIGGTGTTIAVSQECDLMFASGNMQSEIGISQAGRVIQFRQVNGSWSVYQSFTSPVDDGEQFGDSIAVTCSLKRNIATLAIGEPSLNTVYVYSSEGIDFDKQIFKLESTMTVAAANMSIHRFGERGAVAMSGELLAIGAPGLNTVYVYKHTFNSSSSSWYWSSPQIVRSSDYDFDVITGHVFVHRQDFGRSVAISGRTLVIGAPFADYQNLATAELVENYNTEGDSIRTIAKGKMYVYHSSPAISQVCLSSQQVLQRGQFKLTYNRFNVKANTTALSFNSTALEVQQALLDLDNTDEVSVMRSEFYPNVTNNSYGSYAYCWTITFHSAWTDPGTLEVVWKNNSCPTCTGFDYSSPNNSLQQLSVTVLANIGGIQESQSFTAPDGMLGDRFGWSVAIDANQIVVGAPYSSSLTVTSWDFEAGELLGWHKTGTAFDFQPTLGDNLKFRPALTARKSPNLLGQFKSSSVGLRGQYYISTFDKHPDNVLFPAGNVQGVTPTGTLSSDVFMILGDRISFLIGGGCDVYRLYVELLIDGYSVAKVSGKCTEVMKEASFDVSNYRNKAAQIRIVDNSTAAWGYISADDFTFDWEVAGAVQYTKAHISSLGGRTEAIMSGAAYVYLRKANESFPCTLNNDAQCRWFYEAKLLPSDKRENAQFGSQVAVIASRGIVAVGAPNAPLMLSYKDTPTRYPFVLSSAGESSGSGLQFPVQPHNMTLFQSAPSYIPEASGSSAVWRLMDQQKLFPPPTINCGAVYVFAKQHHVLGYTGQKAAESSWPHSETARVQAADLEAGDMFGSSLASSSGLTAMVIGAPGFDDLSADQGAVYLYSLEFASVRFEQVVFAIKEGPAVQATVTMIRDLDVYDGELVLEYATSDLTARGVDSAKFAECLTIPTADRSPAACGDYEQTAGLMVIKSGVTTGGFTVNIMDDYCYERDLKYIQLTLSVPGSGALQGEVYHAQIRIDDDDFASSMRCDHTIV